MSKVDIGKEERVLLMAGVKFARKVGMPNTRLAWGLATIIGKPDNVLYHKICEMSRVLGDGEEALEEYEELEIRAEEIIEEKEMVLEDEALENRVGDIVKVRVVAVKTYGLVCAVENTTRTLLLHLSEVADEFIDDLSEYAQPGDEFHAMLIVNPKNQLGLSARRATPLTRKYAVAEDAYRSFYGDGGQIEDVRVDYLD